VFEAICPVGKKESSVFAALKMPSAGSIEILDNRLKPTPVLDRAVQRQDGMSALLRLPPPSTMFGSLLSEVSVLQDSLHVLRDELESLSHSQTDRMCRLQQVEEELQLAEQVQRDLLPHQLPDIFGAVVQTVFAPAGRISGDLYDVYRIDDHRVAFALADATGHGMPAALLSVFIKRAMRGSENPSRRTYLNEPSELLERLNLDILELGLTQCQFVAAIYAIFDERTRTLCWARGGCPHPILVKPGKTARLLPSRGPLLGVMADADFEPMRIKLEPGDTIIFYSDGLETFLVDDDSNAPAVAIDQTDWFNTLGKDSIDQHLRQLRHKSLSIAPGQR